MDDYHIYMTNLFGTKYLGKTYNKLFEYLDKLDYIPNFIADENRKKDFTLIRDKYNKPVDRDPDVGSYLEFFIAYSYRLYSPTYETDTGWIFWKMLSNLELLEMNDEVFGTQYVDRVLRRFNNREYGANGIGSIFPKINSKIETDWRKISISQQSDFYMLELHARLS